MGYTLGSSYTEFRFNYMRVEKQKETLMQFLLRKFRYHDEQEWKEHIDAGRLLVDGQFAEAQTRLKDNQTITYVRPDFCEPDVDPNFEVLYEDDDLIAVCKSGNIPTSPSGRYFKNTLVHRIRFQRDWDKLYTLHRLDRETSGIVCFAKRHEVAQQIADQFRKKKIQKKYLTLLTNPIQAEHIFVSQPLGPDPDSEVRIKQWVIPDGKPSHTHFQLQETFKGLGKYLVTPLTGRTHQIRVHAAFMGSHVAGDKLYGLDDQGFVSWLNQGSDYLKQVGFPTYRQLLHASELRLYHPVQQKELVIKAGEEILMKELEN